MKIGLLGAMFLILFTLKVMGLVSVSWWVVVLPLFVPLIIWLSVLVVGALLLAGSWFLIFIMELFSKNK